MKRSSCIVHYSLGTSSQSVKLICRYEASGKYKESDDLTFDGIVNMNKYGQVTISSRLLLSFRLSLHMIWEQSISHLSKLGNCPFLQKLQVQISRQIQTRSANRNFKIVSSGRRERKADQRIHTVLFFSCVHTRWCHTTGNALVGYPALNKYAAHYYWEKSNSIALH